ncbi:MAG TPA: flagellar filament capping protein FliD [Candidatus Limnocylindria bacterium]|nr:flagellar filament capping protein FliD [Candidatus Limnocylindria bacterium]
MDLGVSGLASGLDWKTLVSQLIDVERAPEKRLQLNQQTLQQRNNAYGSIQTELSVFQNRVNSLNDTSLFDSRTVASSDSTTATATTDAGAPVGAFTFNFTQLATAAVQKGAGNAGGKLSASNNVTGVTLGSAGFSAAITAGTLTVNGQQVTVATTDTLQGLFDKINTATGGTVTGTYDSSTDKLSLASTSGEVVLGSATDTSNFFQAAKLLNNGTATTSSTSAVGGVRLTSSAATSNLATALSDGGSGAGAFSINGVTINFNSSVDSLQNVLDRINSSTAGVSASYDTVNNRFNLTNKTTGDVGVALADVTGNFLAATGLSGGTLQHGKNLLYTVNGGGQLVSQSNTVTSDSSGLNGLKVTAFKENSSAVIAVGVDNAKIKSAITDFVTEYSRVQSLIDAKSAVTTDKSGKVTAGILTGDSQATAIASSLRSNAYGALSALTGSIKGLSDLGIQSSGYDNALSVGDGTKIDDAIANHLGDLKSFFTDATNGLTTKLKGFLDATIGDNGTLVASQTSITKQSKDIDTQVTNMERLLTQRQTALTNSFVQMESAQQKISQQLSYLSKIGSS